MISRSFPILSRSVSQRAFPNRNGREREKSSLASQTFFLLGRTEFESHALLFKERALLFSPFFFSLFRSNSKRHLPHLFIPPSFHTWSGRKMPGESESESDFFLDSDFVPARISDRKVMFVSESARVKTAENVNCRKRESGLFQGQITRGWSTVCRAGTDFAKSLAAITLLSVFPGMDHVGPRLGERETRGLEREKGARSSSS